MLNTKTSEFSIYSEPVNDGFILLASGKVWFDEMDRIKIIDFSHVYRYMTPDQFITFHKHLTEIVGLLQ